MTGIRHIAVYHHAMGLFRSRAKKNREKAAAEVPSQRTEAAAEVPSQRTEAVEAQVVAARREVRGEPRPDPDRPGWGRSLGQQISKGRDEPAGQQ